MSIALPACRVAVKICGITNEDDARAAIEAGADILGFNTWLGTKRHIILRDHAAWIAELPVVKIALLVNATLAETASTAALPFIDAMQLHGDEDVDECARVAALGKPLVKAIRARDAMAFADADHFSTEHILLDAHVPGAFGGTGARVDFALVREFQNQHPKLTLWLAGGLTAENVAEAVTAVRPRVVDVSSGVETTPGRKDFAKMRMFVAAVREAGE